MSDDMTAVEQVLDVARRHLGMDAAWVTRFSGHEQVVETVVEAEPGLGPTPGSADALSGSYCVRVLDGRLPSIVTDARADPRTRDLAVTETRQIGSYVGTPVSSESGRPRGMLCVMARSGNRMVSTEQFALLELLSQALGILIAAEEDSEAVSAERSDRRRFDDVISGTSVEHTLTSVLQPIVDLRTGALWGVEALARFGMHGGSPAQWFVEAQQLGLRWPLELAAARAALRRRRELPAGVKLAVNLSPDVLLAGLLDEDLRAMDVSDLIIEVTENAAVSDYATLQKTLEPLRARGLQVAVDDAGAGYASFRHIVRLRPEVIKVDLTLIRGIDQDPVCQSLVVSLVSFAAKTGSILIAEGVETRDELTMLGHLGVPSAQGFLLGRPQHDLPALDFPLPPGLRPVRGIPRQSAATPLPTVTTVAERNTP